MTLDWAEVFRFSVSPVELLVRGTLMFWFLFAIFRFLFRRGTGSVGMSDFLFVVLLGDAAQNAMIGQAHSVPEGMVLIATLVGWNYLLDYLSERIPAVEHFSTARRVRLVAEGQVIRHNMRREYISMDELMQKLREAGHDTLKEVKAAYLESDGEISVIPKPGAR